MKRRGNCTSNLVTALGDWTTCLFFKKKKEIQRSVYELGTRNTRRKLGMKRSFLWMHIGSWAEKHSSPIDSSSPRLLHLLLACATFPLFFFLIDIWPIELFNLLLMCSSSLGHIWPMCCDVVHSCVIWAASLLECRSNAFPGGSYSIVGGAHHYFRVQIL